MKSYDIRRSYNQVINVFRSGFENAAESDDATVFRGHVCRFMLQDAYDSVFPCGCCMTTALGLAACRFSVEAMINSQCHPRYGIGYMAEVYEQFARTFSSNHEMQAELRLLIVNWILERFCRSQRPQYREHIKVRPCRR